MKISRSVPARVAALSMSSLVLPGLVSCDKKETPAVAPAPAPAAPAVSPVPAAPAPAPAPAAAEPAAPSPTAAAPGAPQDALASFKADIVAIKTFMEQNQGSSNPAEGLENLRELIKRAAAVNTANIPEDLAGAFNDMSSVMQRVQAALDDLPVPANELPGYISSAEIKGGEAKAEMEAKVAAFQTSMQALQQEGEAASAKFNEAGAKYGIPSLELGQ